MFLKENVVQNIQVYRTLDVNGIEVINIEWSPIVPGVQDIISFKIYRGIGGKNFEFLAETTQPFYQDTNAPIKPGAEYWYKITYLTNQGESSLEEAIPVSLWTMKPESFNERTYWTLISQIRRQNLVFLNFGEKVKIFIKKRVGEKCNKCFDEYVRVPINPRCDVCFGTGYIGGYDKFETKLIISPTPELIREEDTGRVRLFQGRVFLPNYPPVHEEDILIMQDNTRKMISNVIHWRFQLFLILQEVQITELAKGHPAWLLE